jgi:hypothetical protein
MPPLITLEYTDEDGERRRVEVRGPRFRIGRADDNDLVIKDTNLSRHHALIETLSGKPYVSDRGSSNGTSVNDQPVTVEVELYDGDRITLGNSSELVVSIGHAEEEAPPPAPVVAAPVEQPMPAPPSVQAAPPAVDASVSNQTPSRSSVPVVAGVAVALVLLASVVLLVVWLGKEDRPARVEDDAQSDTVETRDNSNAKSTSNTKSKTAGDATTPGATPRGDGQTDATQSAQSGDATETKSGGADDQAMRAAIMRVLSRISTEESAYISDQGVKDVADKVRSYKGSSSLAERLRAMSRGCSEVTSLAQSNNLKPSLIAYAALAQTESGGDPAAVAKQMTPKLLTLRATFGTETANSSLLLVAAYPYPFNPPIGSETRTPHPLASKLQEVGGRRSQVDTSVARSVWFLREKDAISPEAYDLVVRLLAVGVIAQNPRQYGVEADPLFC